MRIAVCILGTEVLAVDLNTDHEREPQLGPPFGFSGSAGVQAERAEDQIPDEDRASAARAPAGGRRCT